jgi:hypothetical protein
MSLCGYNVLPIIQEQIVIITNKHNLPQTFVNIMKRPTYSKGKANISATELLNSPRIVQLRKLHEDKIETDVTEMVWSIFGTAIHGVLEHGKDENHLIEERLHANVDGWSISGAIDLQIVNRDGTVTINDYKTTGAWSVMNEKIEWEQQLNIYAWLVEKVKGDTVSKLEIVAIIRDWSRRDAALKPDYPDAPIKVIPIQLWAMETREAFIRGKIKQHSNALFDLETGDELPPCTPNDMWEKPTTYAVKKTGNVKARNVCATEEEALAKVAEYGKGYDIEVRPGERTRCANFCSVNAYCNQYKEYLSTKE